MGIGWTELRKETDKPKATRSLAARLEHTNFMMEVLYAALVQKMVFVLLKVVASLSELETGCATIRADFFR